MVITLGMSRNQIVGAKFEMWLLDLFKDLSQRNLLNFQNIDYNNKYFRQKGEYRQLDLDFQYVQNGIIKQGMIEAKYCSNCYISFKLRNGELEKNGQMIKGIDNIVSEVCERAVFARATKAILVTNKQFEKRVKEEAYTIGGLYILERPQLIKMNIARGKSSNLEKEIMKSDISYYYDKIGRKYLL